MLNNVEGFSREIASPQRLAKLGTITRPEMVKPANPKGWYCSESIYEVCFIIAETDKAFGLELLAYYGRFVSWSGFNSLAG